MNEGTAQPTNWRSLAWALLPPIAVLLWRAVLQAQTDEVTAGLQALHTATQVTTPGEAMWAAARPFVYTLIGVAVPLAALVVALRTSIRRFGWPRVRPWVLGSWLALWLLVAAGLQVHHLNRTGRQPQAEQEAQVLLVREVRPNERSAGGAEVYLQVPGEAAPLHLLAEGQPASAFAPRSRVSLQAEAGRWWGRWGRVTPLAVPAVPAVPASAPGSGG